MECNKEEAKRAMDIAERKIAEKDYNGAKMFANKAQDLYPDLDGLKQLLMTVDVYISGEKQINGESDWYGILGVDPSANDEEVKKQYRKLALMLHPDKNKCKGAEGAFKLLSEAWSILSDQVRRFTYNIKRQVVKDAPQRFTTTTLSVIPTRPPNPNVFQNVKESMVSSAKPSARMDRSCMDSPASVQKESSTFWKMCNRCKMQYEYKRVYLNKNLLCPNCREGFIAAEKTPPEQDGVKRGFGVSQERDASRGFTNSDLRNHKKPKTDDSHMFGPSSGKSSNETSFSIPSNPAKGNLEMPNIIGSRRATHIPAITIALMNKAQEAIFKRLPKMISVMAEDVKAVEKERKSMKATSKMTSKVNEVEKKTGPVDVRKIPKEEMFRFSHQVPHYILTGEEADNIPAGCLEPDLAATPCELLSEKAEAKDSSQKDIDKSEKSSTPKEEVGMNMD
ncbi:hypothetical protein EUTSA_v10013529mg [Eutrema salsugineum]|uniref:J domain-containing protein n=1 Tax=Eutrema salsugineum TaxID=72664 RepID=V4LL50_EUTSA|nr:uncharacterized protein LOC18017878 [Eutrema salsugineum]ESQ43192.1 hypothetical protein EUTSA_v10013529mg [Eutrema salsugineum]